MINQIDFGYFPRPLSFTSGPITITPLTDIKEKVVETESSEYVVGDWIYAGPQFTRHLGGGVTEKPFSRRVFSLPWTHTILHSKCDGQSHINFHLWALSFFTGMRLSSTEAGFVDATPIKPFKLVDFVLLDSELPDALDLVEAFWIRHRGSPKRAKLVAAAVHALFLGQYPQHLQFEKFILLYTAIDACFAFLRDIKKPSKAVPHDKRILWICSEFGITTPTWAFAESGSAVSTLRNHTLHEALFFDQPLGFAIHGAGTNQNITHEMRALICRLLVAIFGGDNYDYVRSPTNTRQRTRLKFCT